MDCCVWGAAVLRSCGKYVSSEPRRYLQIQDPLLLRTDPIAAESFKPMTPMAEFVDLLEGAIPDDWEIELMLRTPDGLHRTIDVSKQELRSCRNIEGIVEYWAARVLSEVRVAREVKLSR